MIPVKRLNHAVLYVRDAEHVGRVLPGGVRLRGSRAHPRHGGVPPRRRHRQPPRPRAVLGRRRTRPGPERGRVGLYHLAWEVPLDRRPRRRPGHAGPGSARSAGESDHGATKSLYGRDPDGNEFEIMWMVPARRSGASTSTRRTTEPARPRSPSSPAGADPPGVDPRRVRRRRAARGGCRSHVRRILARKLARPPHQPAAHASRSG